MKDSIKSITMKGILTGFSCAVIINIWVVLSFHINYGTVGLYLIGIPLMVITYFLLKTIKVKYFFITCLISLICYFVFELIIGLFGLTNLSYQKAVGDGLNMTAGDGFGIMVIYIFSYPWIILGGLAALIHTVIIQRQTTSLPNKRTLPLFDF